MTMAFQTIRDALIENVLVPAATALGTFRVADYQQTTINSESVLDDLKLIEVFYKGGAFPLSGSVRKGPTKHEIQFELAFIVSKASSMDLVPFVSGTESDKAAALTLLDPAAHAADRAMDQLWDDVYQAVMDVTKFDWGLTRGVVINRYVDRFSKDQPTHSGKHVILSASAIVTCHTQEELINTIPTVQADSYTGEIINDGDDVAKTGVADDL